MSGPVIVDPANAVIDAFIAALTLSFDPAGAVPPIGGGTTAVRFFAGSGPPIAAWDAHATGVGCDVPFLWVRAENRFRSRSFPDPVIDVDACGLPRVLSVEVGVGRCAVVEQSPTWDDYAAEAEISLDDSWHIEMALCEAARALRALGYAVATDTVTPYGPDGGVMGWSAVAYVMFG